MGCALIRPQRGLTPSNSRNPNRLQHTLIWELRGVVLRNKIPPTPIADIELKIHYLTTCYSWRLSSKSGLLAILIKDNMKYHADKTIFSFFALTLHSFQL